MSLDWEGVAAFAAALPGAERATHFGAPAVKANGRAVIGAGSEPGSFVLHIDEDSKAVLIETDPATFWQTPHYEGWPALLVRYDSADPERVLSMTDRAHAWALAQKPPRRR